MIKNPVGKILKKTLKEYDLYAKSDRISPNVEYVNGTICFTIYLKNEHPVKLLLSRTRKFFIIHSNVQLRLYDDNEFKIKTKKLFKDLSNNKDYKLLLVIVNYFIWYLSKYKEDDLFISSGIYAEFAVFLNRFNYYGKYDLFKNIIDKHNLTLFD